VAPPPPEPEPLELLLEEELDEPDELELLELEDELLEELDELLELPLWSCTTALLLVSDPAEFETTTVYVPALAAVIAVAM